MFEAYTKTIEHAATPSGAEIQIMAFARTLIDKLMTSFPDLKNLIMDKGQGNDNLNAGVSSMLMTGGGGGRPSHQQAQQMMQAQQIQKRDSMES